MASLFGLCPFLLKLCADGGCQGPQFKAARSCVARRVNVAIVKRAHFYAGSRSALCWGSLAGLRNDAGRTLNANAEP